MLDRKTPPPFVHTTSFDLIDPIRKKLSNGIEVFLVKGGDQDVIKIEFIFKAGRWFENTLGASYFCSQLINKGTKTKSSFQIAQVFDRYGAHVEIQPGMDFVSISIYGLTKYLEPVLDLFLEIITEPVFPEKELAQHKAIFLQNLKVNEEKTSYVASKLFRKKVFGENHPYGKELEEQQVNNLSKDQISEHFNTFFRNTTVFISGKVDQATDAMLSRKISAINTGSFATKNNIASSTGAFHDRVPKDGSVQSSIRAGKRSLLRADPDYHQAIFTAHLLGGYFGSRLMKNIREEKGLTYGIYASVQPLQHESYFVIGADVNNENVDLTLDKIKKEIRTLRTERISSDELYTAKNHFIGSMQSEITTPFAHADKIKTIHLSGLPKDFYHQMILTTDTITPEQIMETTEKYFHEDSLSEVAVG